MAEPKGTGDHKEAALIPVLLPTASGHLAGTSLTEPSPSRSTSNRQTPGGLVLDPFPRPLFLSL